MQLSDFEQAKKIVAKRKHWIGPHGVKLENIELAVAEGVALGRKEGLKQAEQLIANEIRKSANGKKVIPRITDLCA
jgi:hypothetical protein